MVVTTSQGVISATGNIYVFQTTNGLYYNATNTTVIDNGTVQLYDSSNATSGSPVYINIRNSDVKLGGGGVYYSNARGNGNTPTTLTVQFISDITIDPNNLYSFNFPITAGQLGAQNQVTGYTTIDGGSQTGCSFNFDGVFDYPGLIQNGRSYGDQNNTGAGCIYITVRNITTNDIGSTPSTLANYQGWFVQRHFGSRTMYNVVENCANNCNVSGIGCGGIAGASIGSSSNDGTMMRITNCINNGTVSGNNSAGIVGYDNTNLSGYCNISNSYTLYGLISLGGFYEPFKGSITNSYVANGLSGANNNLTPGDGTWSSTHAQSILATSDNAPYLWISSTSGTLATATNNPFFIASHHSSSPNFVKRSSPNFPVLTLPQPTEPPSPPTIVSVTQLSSNSASVSFIRSTRAISYTATSSPGGFTGVTTSEPFTPIIVTGLTPQTSYTFTVTATNTFGISVSSAASNSITTPVSSIPFSGGTITITSQSDPTTLQYSYSADGQQPSSTGTINMRAPVSIINTNPSASTKLTVKFECDINMTNATSSFYFIIGTSYITIDGNGYNVNFYGVPSYLGLIQNGTSVRPSYSNITIENITTVSTDTGLIPSTLTNGAGWICQPEFGARTSGIIANILIQKCINNCPVKIATGSSSYLRSCGGIAGSSFCSAGYATNCQIRNCINTGDIGGDAYVNSGSGGIVGNSCFGVRMSDANRLGTNGIYKCRNSGNILDGQGCGGIAGDNFGINGGSFSGDTSNIEGCSNTGNILSRDCGGIVGSYSAVNITNCSNRGTVLSSYSGGSSNSGGINGSVTYNLANARITVSNCYTAYSPISGEDTPTNVIISDCYDANGTWSLANAKTALKLSDGASRHYWLYSISSNTVPDNTPFFIAPQYPNSQNFVTETPIVAGSAVATPPPLAPTNVYVDSVTSTSVKIYFDEMEGATSYEVIGFNTAGQSSPISVSGLTPETSYTFSVRLSNISGRSVPSGEVQATTVPSAPTITSVGSVASSSASVTFTAPSGRVGYTYTATSSPDNFEGSTTDPNTPITVNGLSSGTIYTFTVTAKNSNGVTSAASSPSSSIKTLNSIVTNVAGSLQVPTPPTNVTANAQTTLGVTSALISFSPSTGATSYTITSSSAIPLSPVTTTSTNNVVFGGLNPGTSYTFTVRAKNSIGLISTASSPSNEIITVPSAPTNVSASLVTTDSVTISFDEMQGATSYKIVPTPQGTGQQPITAVSSPVTVNRLGAGLEYTFVVTATNASGNSSSSAPLNVNTLAFDAPTITSVGSVTSNSATVSFTPSPGETPSSYTVRSNNVTVATGTSSPITVNGLATGTTYTFTVTATYSNGTSAPSSPSSSITTLNRGATNVAGSSQAPAPTPAPAPSPAPAPAPAGSTNLGSTTSVPTNSGSTTSVPTNSGSTTSVPTTSGSTNSVPTNSGSTTSVPTNSGSTTSVPTTSVPTTSLPTTSGSTTTYSKVITITSNTSAGSTVVKVPSFGVVFNSILYLVNQNNESETAVVTGFGSIYVKQPLKYSYPAGSLIYVYSPNTSISDILAEQNQTIPIADICFVKNTPIETDQGIIPIYKIDPKLHTINNKKVVAITKSIAEEKYLVCFEKNSLGENIPNTRTIVSKYHKVQNKKGKMIEAYKFLEFYDNVKKIEYRQEILYNILMENYEKVNVNNLICETLHPDNIIAKLYKNNYTKEYTNTIITFMNYCKKVKDRRSYEKTFEHFF